MSTSHRNQEGDLEKAIKWLCKNWVFPITIFPISIVIFNGEAVDSFFANSKEAQLREYRIQEAALIDNIQSHSYLYASHHPPTLLAQIRTLEREMDQLEYQIRNRPNRRTEQGRRVSHELMNEKQKRANARKKLIEQHKEAEQKQKYHLSKIFDYKNQLKQLQNKIRLLEKDLIPIFLESIRFKLMIYSSLRRTVHVEATCSDSFSRLIFS